MSVKRRMIPFRMMPGSWGLKGDTQKIAEAEYYYDGKELERELAKIKFSGYELEKELLVIEHKHGNIDYKQYAYDSLVLDNTFNKIDDYEFYRKTVKLREEWREIDATVAKKELLELDLEHEKITDEEYKIGQLEIELKNGDIEKNDFDREVATIKGEPYLNVIEMGIENSSEGYFELDWNDAFVKMLHDDGITGMSDEDVVNKWFNRVCRTVLMQEGADQDYGFQSQQGRPDVEYRRDGEKETGQNDGGASAGNR